MLISGKKVVVLLPSAAAACLDRTLPIEKNGKMDRFMDRKLVSYTI